MVGYPLQMVTGSRALTIFAIDPTNQLLNLLFEVLVGLEVVTAWDGHLQEDDLPNELWVSFKKIFEGIQLLWDAFDAVQSVDSKNELSPKEAVFHVAKTVLYVRLLEATMELRWFNADG